MAILLAKSHTLSYNFSGSGLLKESIELPNNTTNNNIVNPAAADVIIAIVINNKSSGVAYEKSLKKE